MRNNISILWVVALGFGSTTRAFPEEKVDPFFLPRPDFYEERGIEPLSVEECDESRPNLVRQIGIDFKNVFTTKENLVIGGVGLGAAWATSHLDEEIGARLVSLS